MGAVVFSGTTETNGSRLRVRDGVEWNGEGMCGEGGRVELKKRSKGRKKGKGTDRPT